MLSHNDSFELLREKANVLDQKQEFRVRTHASMFFLLFQRCDHQVIASRYMKVCESAKQRRADIDKCLFEHKDFTEKTQTFHDWLAVAKEELERWSESGGGNKNAIQKKLAKIKVPSL